MKNIDFIEVQLRLKEDYDELRERHRTGKKGLVQQLEENAAVYEVMVKEMKEMKDKEMMTKYD